MNINIINNFILIDMKIKNIQDMIKITNNENYFHIILKKDLKFVINSMNEKHKKRITKIKISF
jgi:hypothetical protein